MSTILDLNGLNHLGLCFVPLITSGQERDGGTEQSVRYNRQVQAVRDSPLLPRPPP